MAGFMIRRKRGLFDLLTNFAGKFTKMTKEQKESFTRALILSALTPFVFMAIYTNSYPSFNIFFWIVGSVGVLTIIKILVFFNK